MNEQEELVQKLCRMISLNTNGMTKEQDLINLCSGSSQFEDLIAEITHRFEAVGLSLVRSKYQGDRYYVLTIPGKDDRISPRMYGILGLMIATLNELGPDLLIDDVRDLFKEMWGEVEQLITLNYLTKVTKGPKEYLNISPLGKAALKNVLKNLEIKNILNIVKKPGDQ